LKLYEIYSNDFHKYTTVIWQFPTALVTVNILAINFLLEKPHILIFFPIINFVLLHALFKHVHNQNCLKGSLVAIEKELIGTFSKKIIPNFTPKSKILKKKSARILSRSLLILNVIFMIYTIYKLILVL